MRGESFSQLKNTVQSVLTAYGEISKDACVRQMCDLIIGHGDSITPNQLAELMSVSENAAEHNAEVYDRILECAKEERMRTKR